MLHPAHRNVFARLAFNSRAVTGYMRVNPHLRASAICFRSAFFTLPSLPKLPFGPVPQIVSYSDVRVVPYHSTIVVEAVCDVHRYKVPMILISWFHANAHCFAGVSPLGRGLSCHFDDPSPHPAYGFQQKC
jgi:hypothetical protein